MAVAYEFKRVTEVGDLIPILNMYGAEGWFPVQIAQEAPQHYFAAHLPVKINLLLCRKKYTDEDTDKKKLRTKRTK